jgi:hypothetical protein
MPLNAKGKKILASMEKKYGKKKGKTVFYAMENSGKLKRIKQLRKGGNTGYSDYASPSSSTASQDFATQAVSGGQKDYGGDGGNNQQTTGSKTTTPKSTSGGGSGLLNIGRTILTMGASKLFEAPIGLLTAGAKTVKNLTTDFANKPTLMSQKFVDTGDEAFYKKPNYTLGANNNTGDNNPSLCPDGTTPPCKTPVTQIKNPVSTPNPFLSGFKAYDDGGEVVISSNVDKDLL